VTKTIRTPRIHQVAVPQGWGRTDCLVVIPARDEADRIIDCLGSLAGQGADVLVVANNCDDATSELARKAGAAVIDCTIADGGVGAARRLGVVEGMRRLANLRWLMTSDADCVVAPDWVDVNRAHLEAGAAAVCGLVLPIAHEHAALPPALLRRAALEDRFLDLKARLEAKLTGRAGHEQTPGASLAFDPAAYFAAGGFAPMPTHEDRAIILRLKSMGLPVVHDRNVTVRASCRLEGRAPGGMAAALRGRSIDPDAPLCPDMGRSEIAVVSAVLDELGPLRHQTDLPAAIAKVEALLALQKDCSKGRDRLA
jgi:Glycosyltransferase like family 2